MDFFFLGCKRLVGAEERIEGAARPARAKELRVNPVFFFLFVFLLGGAKEKRVDRLVTARDTEDIVAVASTRCLYRFSLSNASVRGSMNLSGAKMASNSRSQKSCELKESSKMIAKLA